MLRNILLVVLVIVGIYKGLEYIKSDQFQEYGDKTKAPWTCWVNDYLAEAYIVFNSYDEAINVFKKNIKRCPETEYVENATYKIAVCHEKKGGSRQPAIDAYVKYIELYPKNERVKLARKKISLLKINK